MNKEISYKNLDIVRYICSIIVIIVHLETFKNILPDVHYFFNNVISRICVPIFFFITGYFVGKKENKDKDYIKKYVKSTIYLYLFWSIIYIPMGFIYLKEINLSIYLFPLGIIAGFFYIGTWYHLWYFPALICSLLVIKMWKKKYSLIVLFIISFFLLLFGACETYYGVLPSVLQNIILGYKNIFFTTRNFLFFGLFYVLFGYIIGNKNNIKCKNINLKLLISIIFFLLEAYFLRNIKRLDCNILLSAIPLVYYLFVYLISIKDIKFLNFKFPLRELYKYYYLIHMLVIFIGIWISANILKINISLQYQIPFLIIVILITHLISNIFLKKKI